jgi:hypothetical protein
MNTSEAIDKITEALVSAQRMMKPALKDAENPHFKSKYADLAAVWEACRGPFSDNGIAIVQDATSPDETRVQVTTRLIHSSGQWMEFGPLSIPNGKRDAHGAGSAITYAKRYALSAAIGIVTEDDDGNAAVEAPKMPARKRSDVPPLNSARVDFWNALKNARENGFVAAERVMVDGQYNTEKVRVFVTNLLKMDVADLQTLTAEDWVLALKALVKWKEGDAEYTT